MLLTQLVLLFLYLIKITIDFIKLRKKERQYIQ